MIHDYRQYVHDWMLMYKEWRERHLHQTKAWRGKRVRGCWNKIPFEKYIDAEKVRFHMPPREHVLLVVYLCRLCGKYHTGNSRGEYYRQVVTKVLLTPMQASPILEPAIERNPSMITLIPCDSSMISGYHYDDSSWVLAIQFRSTGDTRLYAEFPPEMYSDFENAKSKGKFYNEHIKEKFPVQKSEDVAFNADYVATDTAMKAGPPVIINAELDADIAAQEAEWARNDISPREARGLFDHAKELNNTAADIPNGFDAPGDTPKQGTVAEVLPPEAELPKKNDAQITAMTLEAKTLAAKPIIVTAETYQAVYDHVADMVARRKRIFEFLDPVREAMYRAYSLMLGRQKEALEPLDNAIQAGKRALLAYDHEQDRLRAAAQKLADEAASKAAEAERRRVQEELTLAEVGDALAVGDTAKAEDLIANPIEVAPVQVYAQRVTGYQAPVVSGKSTRKNWKAELVNIEELIVDVAKGIEHFRKNGNLGGHAPATLLELNAPAANQLAKSQENMFSFPGLRASNNTVMSVRTK